MTLPAAGTPFNQTFVVHEDPEAIIQQLVGQRMFPLTLAGLEGAMRLLSK